MNYFSRFIIGTGLLVGVLVSGGCRKHTWRDQPLRPEDTALVDAMLILRCNDLQTKAEATREEQEKQINDLNLFFVHKHYPSVANPEVRHYYFSSVDVAKRLKLTNIRLGKYRLYAVANAGGRLCSDSHHPTEPTAVGESMCSMTEDQIKALVWENKTPGFDLTKATELLMTSVDENMEIKWAKHAGVEVDEGDIVPITITLKRKVAKFQLSYEVGTALKDKLKIKSIEVKNVPAKVALFKNNVSGAGEFLTSYRPLKRFTPCSGENIPRDNPIIFYLSENMQEPVPTITNPEDRNGRNAPKFASYIFLDTEAPDPDDGRMKQYGLPIYLGDNTTDNFAVAGNAYYHVHLQLEGLNDIRVSSLKINVRTPFPEEFFLNQPQEAIVEIVSSNCFNDELQLTCSAPGAPIGGYSFQVIEVDKDDNEIREFDPVSGQFWYNVLVTDDQEPYERSVRCKVRYIQTVPATPIQMNLMLRSKYGTATVVDRKDITVY